MTKLIPIGERIVFEPSKTDEKIGSIFIPENAKEKPVEGTIIAIGEGSFGKFPTSPVKVGDRVIVSRYCGTEIKVDGNEYRVVSNEDILAVLKT